MEPQRDNSEPVRILIVDDQAPFREAAKLVIEAADGFEVAGEADCGEAAVEAVADLQPDLVLMDINLPTMNGIEATRLIKEGSPTTIVLLLSTYAADEYETRAAECGAAGFLSKSELTIDRLTAAWAASKPLHT